MNSATVSFPASGAYIVATSYMLKLYQLPYATIPVAYIPPGSLTF